MKRTFIAIAGIILFAATAAFSEGEGAAAASAPAPATAAAVPAATNAAAFADLICYSALSDTKQLASLFSIEFSVRSTIPKSMLDQMGITVEEAVKKSEEEIMKSATDQPGPEACSVFAVKEMECKDMYKKIEKMGYFGMPVALKNIEDAASLMKIDSCAVATLLAKDKTTKEDTPVEFGIGRAAGQWKILTVFIDQTPKPDDKEKK